MLCPFLLGLAPIVTDNPESQIRGINKNFDEIDRRITRALVRNSNGDYTPTNAGITNLGDATYYWADVSYKTLTDRGCLGWFDKGVELRNGKIVPDTEALLAIERDENKTTVYGKPMLKYSSFPKVAYKPALKAGDMEGVEMTAMFSIMIGSIRELTVRVKDLEAKNIDLKNRLNTR